MKWPLSRIALLIVFLFPFLAVAQQSATDGKSLLWKITSSELKKPSYLLGTIHLICPEDLVWTPAMKKSLQEAEKICLEMDMDDPSLMMEIALGMVDNSGKKLKDYFTAEQYVKVTRFVSDSLKMDIAMFQQVKPVALHTLLATKSAECADAMAYETMLTDEAKKQNKEVIGLEAASEQLELLNNMPEDSVINDLLEVAMGGYKDEREKYRKLVQLYKSQDLPALYSYIEQHKNDVGDINAFLSERNEKWISRMTEKMDSNSVFFAVGAGHLWGERGVITLLRKSGYKVTPVR
ncbi:MAG: TraB/GumN family protein [Sphingobacteriales bacterium]|nr:MAG: TraB/GumN family protein [Sphingobacteriales bacterium]